MKLQYFMARTYSGAFVCGRARDDHGALLLLKAWHPRECMEGAEVFWADKDWNGHTQLVGISGGRTE